VSLENFDLLLEETTGAMLVHDKCNKEHTGKEMAEVVETITKSDNAIQESTNDIERLLYASEFQVWSNKTRHVGTLITEVKHYDFISHKEI